MKGGGSPEGSMGVLVDVLPSMPKGETVGNIVIDGKGAQERSTRATSAITKRTSLGEIRRSNKEA